MHGEEALLAKRGGEVVLPSYVNTHPNRPLGYQMVFEDRPLPEMLELPRLVEEGEASSL